MYLAGVDLYDIMKVTGHTSPAMLKKYIKADSLKVVEKLPTSTITSSNLPHSDRFLHHFLNFGAENSFLRQKNTILAL